MELEITLKIEAPELVQAIGNLATAIAVNTVKVADVKPTVEIADTEVDAEPKAKPRKRRTAKAEPVKEEPADEEAEKEVEQTEAEVEQEQPEVDEVELRTKLKHNLIEANKKGIITKADMQAVLKKHGAKNLSALPIDVLAATAKKFLGDDYDK
ncbi:MAG TPA: hypothetical protein H9979_09195 [Candidatus Megamonas gallistercoris]|nr:hypothetical protein [Candidatus Megamonas gallistercoris]